ncbi:MAG: hypothetical protein MJ071_03325 [Oscillospiraceae bacterium]|nr:hypothetical protein [Oscillospiraceae bacterium]
MRLFGMTAAILCLTAAEMEIPLETEPIAEPFGVVYLDTEHVYDQMTGAYSQGYVPVIQGNDAVVVFPLLCEGTPPPTLMVSLALGDPDTAPFVCRNYARTVSCEQHPVDGGTETIPAYYAAFHLELRSDRRNGSYPVTAYFYTQDHAISLDYTTYVTITDGISEQTEPEPVQPVVTTEQPVLPKLLLTDYHTCHTAETAGDTVTLSITLQNMSQKTTAKNLTITAAAPEEICSLIGVSDTQYCEQILPGDTGTFMFSYEIRGDVPEGQYGIPLTYDYTFGEGQTAAGQGTARISVVQPLKMDFAMVQVPSELVVSDRIMLNVQAMNLSHADAYHVRAVLEADGFFPENTAFLGTVPGGESAEGSITASISALYDKAEIYGMTDGTITFFYEDRNGKEYTQVQAFSTEICSPFTEMQIKDSPQDEPKQWWYAMGAALAVLAALAVYLIIRRRTGGGV